MRTQIGKYFLIISLLVFLITSCNTGTKTDKENDIRFDSIQVKKTYHLLDNPQNPNCDLQINFVYPVDASHKEVLKKMQTQFIEAYFGEDFAALSPEEAVSRYADNYLKEYKDMETDFQTELDKSEDGNPGASWFSYYEMLSGEIAYNRNNILSYTVSMESYTGGAHGAHSYMNHVINVKTGEAIQEKEIFVDDYQDSLAKLLVAAIAKQNNLTDTKELENIGFFSVDEIFPNGNFLIDDTGITYSFNEYEIAAYVVGLINVHLPYEEIKHLLRPESPISHLF